MKTKFREIKIYGTRQGDCGVCGKPATRKTNFAQTINPFNKDANGNIKTEAQIMKELQEKRTEWIKGQPTHKRCEG